MDINVHFSITSPHRIWIRADVVITLTATQQCLTQIYIYALSALQSHSLLFKTASCFNIFIAFKICANTFRLFSRNFARPFSLLIFRAVSIMRLTTSPARDCNESRLFVDGGGSDAARTSAIVGWCLLRGRVVLISQVHTVGGFAFCLGGIWFTRFGNRRQHQAIASTPQPQLKSTDRVLRVDIYDVRLLFRMRNGGINVTAPFPVNFVWSSEVAIVTKLWMPVGEWFEFCCLGQSSQSFQQFVYGLSTRPVQYTTKFGTEHILKVFQSCRTNNNAKNSSFVFCIRFWSNVVFFILCFWESN